MIRGDRSVTEGLIFRHFSFYHRIRSHPVDRLNRANSGLANF